MPRTTGLAGKLPWLGSGLAAVAVFGASSLVWMPSAGADVDSYYQASARSVVVDAYFSNPSVPTGIRPEGGGPQTDAVQSSLDKGDANASFPYFGDSVATAPGVVGGLFGIPVPPYPLTASSTFGGAPARVNYPGIELSATSRATSTVADAIFGSAGAGGVSHSEVDETADGNVTASSAASAPLTVLGPLVSVKGLDSAVSVTADANGTLTRTSKFSIDEISVPGVVLRLPDASPSSVPVPFPIPVPGVPAPAPIPLQSYPVPNGGATLVEPKIGFINGYFVVQPLQGDPQKYVVPADAVVSAFEAQGVTLSYTAPQETKDGILGGVFSVQYTLPSPPDNPVYNGETPASFSLGDTRAAVSRAPETAGGPDGGIGIDAAAGSPSGALPGAALPGNLPGTDLAGIGALPAAPGGVPTVNLSPQAGIGSDGASLVAAGLPAFLSSDFSSIYLALVGLTLFGLLAAALLGAKGVSARWNS